MSSKNRRHWLRYRSDRANTSVKITRYRKLWKTLNEFESHSLTALLTDWLNAGWLIDWLMTEWLSECVSDWMTDWHTVYNYPRFIWRSMFLMVIKLGRKAGVSSQHKIIRFCMPSSASLWRSINGRYTTGRSARVTRSTIASIRQHTIKVGSAHFHF